MANTLTVYVLHLFTFYLAQFSQPLKIIFVRMSWVLAAIIVSIYFSQLFLKDKSFYIGYNFHAKWWKDFILGILHGISLLSVVLLISLITHNVVIKMNFFGWPDLILLLCQGFLLFGISAAFEEITFRGFPLQSLLKSSRVFTAILIAAIPFAVIHLGNPNLTKLGWINTWIAGIWLGIARCKTNSLWLATGMHLGWNFATVCIWGVPVSGIQNLFSSTILSTRSTGATWLTGGSYGPEGGILCSIAILLASAWLWNSSSLRNTEAKALNSNDEKDLMKKYFLDQ